MTLFAGILGGITVGMVWRGIKPASLEKTPKVEAPSVAAPAFKASQPDALAPKQQAEPQPEQTAGASMPPAAGTTIAGMPGRLPDGFLGIRFGSFISDLVGRGQWRQTGGNIHRKADFSGAQVEAVLTPDEQGRFIMGSYVRITGRQVETLSPFLEWAVNAQDAVSALYGEPSRIHQIEGASVPLDVVQKIASGEDFYEASWERDGEDTWLNLSIRVFNERSVVFRLEYRSRDLTAAFLARQSAATQKSGPENADDRTPNKSTEDTPK